MTDTPQLGPVLVVGYHIIKILLQDPACGPIVATSRNPTTNLQDNVTYRSCDITNITAISKLLDETKPQVIFHAASPRPAEFSVPGHEFFDTNVQGTKNLLASATAISSVKAFVFTSSVSVFAGEEHLLFDETRLLWQPSSKTTPYEMSKSTADKLVLEANCEKLRTVSLRLSLVIGERDNSYVPLWMDAPTNVQIGYNKNLLECMHVDNAVNAHILAAKALMDPRLANGKVDGEAFIITDGSRFQFWDLSRLIWNAAGNTTPISKVTVIPASVALIMAAVAKWAFWIFTLGQRKPQSLNKLAVLYCIRSHTYNIEKARKILVYKPVPNLIEGGVKTSVAYEVQRRAAKQQINGALELGNGSL
ncbi:hypothetical protein MMC17_005467 [Xylographa soralifera]|nr:hypothetical protein [Xylographa soralifera]